MLIHIKTDYETVGKGKFPKSYILETYRCDKCGKTIKVENSYIPTKCHHCEMGKEDENGQSQTE